MQIAKPAITLAEQSRPDSPLTDVHHDFHLRLLEIVRDRPIDTELGEQLKTYVYEWLKEHTLSEFSNYSDDSYQRTYLGRCASSGWEAIIMTWKCGNTTTIHSHPQFAGYNFADGRFRVEIFDPTGDGTVRLKDILIVDGPTGFYAVGQPGNFNNHIHRITCLSQTGHSLHVYSDDALRGCVYKLIEP